LIFNSDEFVFNAPRPITRARRVLIKPDISTSREYPYTTSPKLLSTIIDGVRRVSDADIMIIGGTPDGSPVADVYKALGYDFPRVIMVDVKDCVWVEVDNPLEKPLAIPTFLIPNIVLSSDYLITTCPLKVENGRGMLSIANLLPLLSVERYGKHWQNLNEFDMQSVLADLYFTMPFDMGIIEGESRLDIRSGAKDMVSSFGKVYQGEPYYIDREMSTALNIETTYLDLVDEAEAELEGEED
jgi:uncharacterized protein (DUF362 family)